MVDSNNIILSYHNVCLRRRDLDLLNNGQWLNDIVIGFIYEYYEHDQFESLISFVSFVSPELVQFIKLSNCTSDIFEQISSSNLIEKAFVFIPVNDNDSYEEAGGLHWSLLVYEKDKKTFHHFDSSRQLNDRHARTISNKLFKAFSGNSTNEKFEFNCHVNASQQKNGYDCGVFMICFTEKICDKILSSSDTNFDVSVTEKEADSKRLHIKELIFRQNEWYR